MSRKERRVKRRAGKFTTRTKTRIWHETATEDNPYLTERCLCHGYDLEELLDRRSFIEVLFLLFLGELPSPAQAQLLETLFIALINPGPRHPATRAAMNAGVSRTNTANILPLSLAVLSGNHLGGGEVTAAMRFLDHHLANNPESTAAALLKNNLPPAEGDFHIAPGFGSRFGGIDPPPRKLATRCRALAGSGRALAWGGRFAELLESHALGWLASGVAAAVFLDLGFPARAGAGMFQLACAPGLLAHGLELADKPVTAMPFVDEEHYIIDASAKKRE